MGIGKINLQKLDLELVVNTGPKLKWWPNTLTVQNRLFCAKVFSIYFIWKCNNFFSKILALDHNHYNRIYNILCNLFSTHPLKSKVLGSKI